MAIYVGETLTIVAHAIDPLRSQSITDAQASVEFFAPTKDPKNVPADRAAPDRTASMTFDTEVQRYLAYVETGGWEPGRWSYRVLLAGAYDTWEYGSVTLKA